MKVRLDEILDAELSNCKQVALTLDHWTSCSNDAYQVTTLHYTNNKFKLGKWVLGISPFSMCHTGKNIAEYLDKLIEGNEALNSVQRRIAVVDQTYNMKVALSLSLQEESLNEGSIQCAHHKLNTSFKRKETALRSTEHPEAFALGPSCSNLKRKETLKARDNTTKTKPKQSNDKLWMLEESCTN